MALSRRARWALRHPITQNALSLYWLQFATFAIPLLAIPYLARVLEPTALGALLTAQSFALALTFLIEYAFVLSATREIAEVRDDDQARARVAADVLAGKMVLVAATAVIAPLAWLALPILREDPAWLIFGWLLAVASGMSPAWYFYGVERVRLFTSIEFAGRVVWAALLFVLVNDSGDGWLALALSAATALVAAVLTNTLMYREIAAAPLRLRGALSALRRGWTLFVGIGATTFYTTANVIILGLFAAPAQVAQFGAAERVVRAATRIVGPAATAIYPRVSRLLAQRNHERAWRLGRIAVLALGGLGLLAGGALVALAPIIVSALLGEQFDDAVPVMRVLAIIVPSITLATLLANFLISLRMDVAVRRVLLTGGGANIGLAIILAPSFGALGMAVSVVLSELGVVAVLALILRRRWGSHERAEDERGETGSSVSRPPTEPVPDRAAGAHTGSAGPMV